MRPEPEPPLPPAATSEVGPLIAAALSGSWRRQPDPLCLSPAALAKIAPLLLQTGAGALGWWRVKATGLADTRPGRHLRQAYRQHALRDALHERAVIQTVALVLGPEDHLRLLCLHMLVHGVCRPLWLCDIGAALESRPAEFDWRWFLSGDPRRTRWALCALGLAHELLGARLQDTPVAERAR